MKIILDYLLSIVYLLYFYTCLLIFHPMQMFCIEVLKSPKAQQKVVHWLNFFLLYGVLLTGSVPKLQNKHLLPTPKTMIIIANHQSMWDIVGLIWFLRKFFPVFVSKIELAKGIPSISYNLQKSGSAIINRKEGKESVVKIMKMGKIVIERGFSAAIFPEGTRSRNDNLRDFHTGGIAALLKTMPNAEILPIAISGTGRFSPHGIFPVHSFQKMTWTVLESFSAKGKTPDEVIEKVKAAIEATIK